MLLFIEPNDYYKVSKVVKGKQLDNICIPNGRSWNLRVSGAKQLCERIMANVSDLPAQL